MTVSCLNGAVGRSALTPATLSTGLRPLAPVLDEFWPTADQVINGVLNRHNCKRIVRNKFNDDDDGGGGS